MKATALAGSNIAFVKYWGALDPEAHLPLNNSISLTLDQANTLVTIEFSPHIGHDVVEHAAEVHAAELHDIFANFTTKDRATLDKFLDRLRPS